MNKSLCIFVSIFLDAIISFGQNTSTHPNAQLLEKSVVVVECYDNFNNLKSWGSGVIINSTGICVTCYHVLKDAYYVKILTEQGTEYDMNKIIGENENLDLVKFTIKNSNKFLFTSIKISKVIPQKGDDVWAMGTPDDIENINQFTHGGITNIFIVNNTKILQTDAKIAHGSSGGGLFNAKGELIAITTAKFKGEDATLAGRNIAIGIEALMKLKGVYKDRINTYLVEEPKKYELPPITTQIQEVPRTTNNTATAIIPQNEYHNENKQNPSTYDNNYCTSIRMPNAFVAGKGSLFFPQQISFENIEIFNMKIYSRYGQLVYEINSDKNQGWDGTCNSIDQPGGIYVYEINVTFKDGRKESCKGNLTMLR